jgi:transposase
MTDSTTCRFIGLDVHNAHVMVAGLRRDYNAVKAGLSLPWSQGQTEGQVNRLKFLKRQSFGRAYFDLLPLRVRFES